MFNSRDHQSHDFAGDDAYRAWLISRNQAPIIQHSGNMHWKRLLVAGRYGANRIRSCLAALRVALVADKLRRVRHDLQRHAGRTR